MAGKNAHDKIFSPDNVDAFANAVALSVRTANDWLLTVMGMEHDELQGLLTKYFKSSAVADCAKVTKVMRLTQAKMVAEQKIKVRVLPHGIGGMKAGGGWGQPFGVERIYLNANSIVRWTGMKNAHLG